VAGLKHLAKTNKQALGVTVSPSYLFYNPEKLTKVQKWGHRKFSSTFLSTGAVLSSVLFWKRSTQLLAAILCRLFSIHLLITPQQLESHPPSSLFLCIYFFMHSGCDDLLPILSFVIIQSGIAQLVSECEAMEEFIPEG